MDTTAAELGQLFNPSDFAAPRRRQSTSDSHSVTSDTGPRGVRRFSSVHEMGARNTPSFASLPRGRPSSVMSMPTTGFRGSTIHKNVVKPGWSKELLLNPSSTMCAIAIAANAAQAMNKRKKSSTRFFSSSSKDEPPSPHLRGNFTDVRFTEIAEPPKTIKNSEVLVQVFACALDFQ